MGWRWWPSSWWRLSTGCVRPRRWCWSAMTCSGPMSTAWGCGRGWPGWLTSCRCCWWRRPVRCRSGRRSMNCAAPCPGRMRWCCGWVGCRPGRWRRWWGGWWGAGGRLVFRHGLMRQALYEGMPAGLRSALHRQAAQALARAGVPAEQVAEQLPHVLDTADAWVVDWLADAASGLVDRAPQVAVDLLQRVREVVPVGDRRRL